MVSYLSYIGWINDKVLLYSTGNYVQYPVIIIMEMTMKKKNNIYIIEMHNPEGKP